jgi:acetoin utilization protein AcuB
MRARDLMTPNPVTVAPQARIAEAWDLMRELDIRHVPVVAGGALVGMLSDRDLARLDMTGVLSSDAPEVLRQELAAPIAKVMHPDVIVVEPETGLGEIVDLLLEHKVGALPVVAWDTYEALGIVSYLDVLRVIRDRLDEA